MSDREGEGATFFRGLICGALAGAGLFYFLTNTEEGKRVKKKIKKQGKDVLDSLTEMVGELEEKGKEFKEKAKEFQAELEEKAKDLGGEIAQETKERLTQIEELRERGRKVAKLFTRNGKPLKKAS